MATATGNLGPTLDLWEAFTTNEIFHTRDDLVRWARDVGRLHGVVVIILRSETTDGGKGKHNKIVFGCDRQGKYKHVVDIGCSSRRKSSKKCGCPFKLKAKPLDPPFFEWRVKVICGIHNHGPKDTMEGTWLWGRFLKQEVSQLGEHLWLNVKASNSLSALKERFPLNLSSIRQLYRLRQRLRKEKRGSRTEIQQLMTLIEENHYLCWSRKLEGSNVVEEIMWANPESIKLLRMFPQVLIMDCTFKTNKYFLPLLAIVGVTSTNLTFSIAFAYLSHERYGDYSWALNNLRDLMLCDIDLPKVILTDKEEGLMKAVYHVFPEATNLLCRYHINKNVQAKLKKAYKSDRRVTTMELWHKLVDCFSETEFFEAYSDFEKSCSDKPHIVKYVNDEWLLSHKERFCGAWTDKVRHLGNTTTNRVESMHWALKKALGASGGDLCGVWEHMHGMIKGQLGKIIVSFQDSINRVDAHHNIPFYQPLWGQVSREALELIHDEYVRSVEYVGYNNFLCGCVMKTTHGLPCACELGMLGEHGLPITLDLIDTHWKRLSIDCMDEERVNEASVDCDLTYTIEEVYKKWSNFTIEERQVWKRGLDDYVFKKTTNMVPPLHKIKTRGAPKKDKKKKKKDYDVRRDPSNWEHVDAMDIDEEDVLLSSLLSKKKPTKKTTGKMTPKKMTIKTPKNMTPKTTQDSTQQFAHMLKKAFQKPQSQHDMGFALQFPEPIQRFIDDIINVEGDGHCGFRCISALMSWGQDSWQKVRNDLGQEIDMNWNLYQNVMGDRLEEVRQSLIALPQRIQPPEKWMSMPDLGHVIATTYQVALVMLSPASATCFTFFPLRGEYRPMQSELLCVGFVNGNHWVRVYLNNTSPLPRIHPSWGRYSSEETNTWYTPYMGRLQLWENLIHCHLPQNIPFFPDYIDITEE